MMLHIMVCKLATHLCTNCDTLIGLASCDSICDSIWFLVYISLYNFSESIYPCLPGGVQKMDCLPHINLRVDSLENFVYPTSPVRNYHVQLLLIGEQSNDCEKAKVGVHTCSYLKKNIFYAYVTIYDSTL